ncbi:MAG: hypothetical protein ACYC2T_01755 [Bacillota bacterium]
MGDFCIPKIQKRVVCKIGEKCFHDRHFTDVCTFIGGEIHNIPADACVIAPPQVINRCEKAVGQIDHTCIRIEVSYTINVVLQSLSTGEVCIATIDVCDLPLNIPIQDVNTDPHNPLVLCKEPFYEEVFKKKPLNAYDARVVPSPVNPGFGRLVVRIEKLFIAVKYSLTALVCEQACAIQQCVPDFPPLPECPPFTAPTQCPDFCFTDDNNPLFQCTDCPPVQTTTEPPEPPPHS